MKPGKRFGLSAEQKIDVWRRREAGQTLHEIGRAFGTAVHLIMSDSFLPSLRSSNN